MEPKLTDEQISHLCMYMRIMDLMKKNPQIVNTNPELKKAVKLLKKSVGKIMALLTPEQIDEILEEHKIQLKDIKKRK